METTLTPTAFDATAPDREAPLDAFRFDAPQVKFAATGTEQSQSKSVELLARTGEAIEHWYWGRIVHDMEGMQTKAVIAFDWCHGNDLVGKGDKFDISTGDLVVGGTIESLEVGDLADQIIKRSGRGIPYEASIYFDPWSTVLEYLPEGLSSTVNGRLIDGPCIIAREWTLRRIAICPSGADGGTEARFTSGAASVAKFALNWKGSTVTKSTAPANPAPAAASAPGALAAPAAGAQATATPATAATTPATQLAASESTATSPTDKPTIDVTVAGGAGKSEFELRFERFTTEFGAEAATEYLRAGLSYEAALKADLEKTKLALKSAEQNAQTAQQKLASVNLGEQSAVNVGVASGDDAGGKHTFASCFSAAQGKGKKRTQ